MGASGGTTLAPVEKCSVQQTPSFEATGQLNSVPGNVRV